MRTFFLAILLVFALPVHAQSSLFKASQLKARPMQIALESLHAETMIAEWIKLTEIPAPSGKEQERAAYVRGELEKLGLTDIRVDELSNVSAVRKGTGHGPTIVLAAHLDTVFPLETALKVKRDGDVLRAPGIGDDSVNVVGMLEAFRALKRAGIRTKGDVIFLASTQEELGLVGAKHWLEKSGYKPDMFIALDLPSNEVWYGALRISQIKVFFTAPGAHTLMSRGEPNPVLAAARAVSALYAMPLPPLVKGTEPMRLPTLNIGMISGGGVANAIPREASFTIDLRSTENETQAALVASVQEQARRIAEQERVGFRIDNVTFFDYSKALPPQERLDHSLVQTAVAVTNHFRKAGSPAIVPKDLGSTDANVAVSLGIPAIGMGLALSSAQHQLEESADASSFVPGTKALIALTVALANQ
jgi:acetylornithine deacetylase/succinyl-diaminopimelate desuccinylase-like protein